MSAYLCAYCGGLRDADDGCGEAPNGDLICRECAECEIADAVENDEDALSTPPADHVLNTEGG